MPALDPLTVPWYAVLNDTIGGWDVATGDLPTSQHGGNTGVHSVAVFASRSVAEHIARLHNAWLNDTDRLTPPG